jgi:hypothetical protein
VAVAAGVVDAAVSALFERDLDFDLDFSEPVAELFAAA